MENFAEMFPQIQAITIEIEETALGGGKYRKREYTALNIPDNVRCTNPLCTKSGISIWWLLQDMTRKKLTELKTTEPCNGSESMGHGQKRDCMRLFTIEIHITYKGA